MFAKTKFEAIERYKHFVAEGKGVDIWQNLKSQVYLGDDEFVEKHKITIKDNLDIVLNEVPKKQVRPKAQSLSYYQLSSHDNKIAMAQAYLSGGYSMKEIANYFDVHCPLSIVHCPTVSRAVAQCKT